MIRKEYSAGMVKASFWFAEFRKVIQLLNAGQTMTEIKMLNLQQNIIAAPNQSRSIEIFNAVSARVQSLNASFWNLFEECDISTQKMINLISIMVTDSLFFDFVYEIYREKLILGIDQITDSDIQVFFKNKQVQSVRAAKWSDETLNRLVTCYKTLLSEAGLVDRAVSERRIFRPILDTRLEDCLKKNKMGIYINALTGVR